MLSRDIAILLDAMPDYDNISKTSSDTYMSKHIEVFEGFYVGVLDHFKWHVDPTTA